MSQEYYELLQTDEWAKRRMFIMNRDNHQCTICRSPKNLQVHHTYYYTEWIPPWQYPDRCMITLCEDCHYQWHKDHELEYKINPKTKQKGVKLKKKSRLTPKKKLKSIAEQQSERMSKVKPRTNKH